MPLTVSKQKNGTLTLGGVAFACQARNVKIVPPEQSDDATDEVLCGDLIPPDEGGDNAWILSLNTIQDWADPIGLTNHLYDNQGETEAFVWAPTGAAGPSWGGQVIIWPSEVGGDVNKRLEAEVELKCIAKPVRTDPV
jgi:hypothetical protein